ncbi:antifreeze protein Maxi-like [Chelonus insularis]|uniref:antifreeze protein Maxi-like n=1 Tax=Chelonus insularis TaxID=460826 RepID=UPI00158DD59A|nr:antifreeze protein Maxi-like [Chelonus insularis]
MNILLILVVCVSFAASSPAGQSPKDARKTRGFVYDDASLGLLHTAIAPRLDSYPAPSSHGHHKTGFSVGGGLVSIARGAADQARTQVANQHSAAKQAAYTAKNTLAQAAAQSAATAAAALAGKQIILSGLEQQSRDAHVAVDGEKMQLQQASRAAAAARNAAQQAMHQVQVITAALNAAQATSDHAAQAAAEAAAELAAQTTMLGQAKARAQTIDEQLAAARIDFAATQSASDKAAAAAQLAQNNAAAAAAHASESAATSAPLPTVAEEEDGPHAALVVDSAEEPNHGASFQAVNYADDHSDEAYIPQQNAVNHAHGDYAYNDNYDYKGYY